MTTRSAKVQIAFRYRTVDSPSGVTRKTAKRLAERLGVDETQAIHLALHELAAKVLPQYDPKPRPALILIVFDDDAPRFEVRVAYGTSQRTTTLHRGEFLILRSRNPAAYQTAGLSYDTKFDLKQTVDLSYTTEWFSMPPAAPHGHSPKLGTLHPSLVRALEAAYRAAAK